MRRVVAGGGERSDGRPPGSEGRVPCGCSDDDVRGERVDDEILTESGIFAIFLQSANREFAVGSCKSRARARRADATGPCGCVVARARGHSGRAIRYVRGVGLPSKLSGGDFGSNWPA